ncbi:bifunctional DNA-formamidopyrimidine glycosylase/DNA-(apurinic or apyrimidinic site) lyase [Desulfohalobium retbaense]|nr:bifunctional DNA-formamidopyrimidine glycosylase/DNA-(apurinic or apyrimidinic site) lyase [Desulfohalobium retbaense]
MEVVLPGGVVSAWAPGTWNGEILPPCERGILETAMPELPEVETIARGLDAALTGQHIASVHLRRDAVACGDAQRIREDVPGRCIKRVWRRAKLLLVDCVPDRHLVFHLKMSGKLLLGGPLAGQEKHVQAWFGLQSGESFVFQDVRKFGYIRLFDGAELAKWPFFASLGPEPFDLDGPGFARILSGRRARIKSLLLDQTVIAGIGNIYADEALFRAGIHPATPADRLSPGALNRLVYALHAALNKGFASGGSSLRDYVDALGKRGSHQNEFQVYGRCGASCPCCGRCLERTTVAGRTSTFCPRCQPLSD